MSTEDINGADGGSRRMRGAPTPLDLSGLPIGIAVGSPVTRDAPLPVRQQHDSVLDSRLSPHMRSPFKPEPFRDVQETSFWLDDAAAGIEPSIGSARTPNSLLAPPRKESLHHLSAATSPLAHTLDDEYLTTTGTPPLKASANNSPNIRQEPWWRSDSRPGSGLPSPTVTRAFDARNSAASAIPIMASPSASNLRLRGMTASSAQTPSLHHSASYGDLRMSNRTLPANVYRPSRGPGAFRDSAQSAFRREPFIPPFAEEARASVRSAWTTHSSGFLGSDRSSVMTRASSTSELVRINQKMDDLLMSVEDAISMYANGFSDDEPDDSAGEDSEDETSPPRMFGQSPADRERARSHRHDAHRNGVEKTPTASRSASDPTLQTPTSSPLHKESPASKSSIHNYQDEHDDMSDQVFMMPHGQLSSSMPRQRRPDRRPSEPDSFLAHAFAATPADQHEVDSTQFYKLPQSVVGAGSRPNPVPKDGVFDPASSADPPLTTHTRPYLPLPKASERHERDNPGEEDTDSKIPKTPPPLPPPPIERDRYGFKKATQYITVEQYNEWNEGYSEYLDRRRIKWRILMKQYGLTTDDPVRFPPKTEKVKRYIRKGIPPEWRGAAWFWYAGGPGRLMQHSGLYWSLIEQVQRGALSDADREHIERDLNRTFPDNIKFKPDTPRRKASHDNPEVEIEGLNDTSTIRSLRRVLQAFALHNQSIGYCQSLNFLAGLLLLFLDEDEEKAFIMLDVITSEHLPGTHAKVLEANVDIGVLMTCIKESMPAVWAKIDDNADDTMLKPAATSAPSASLSRLPTVSLATTAWFMSCFIGNLPVECVLRTWDVFFYEGSKTLFRIALTIFKLGEPEIRGVTEHMEIFQLVQSIPRRLIDANGLMEACYKKRNGFQYLSQDTVDQRRVERRKMLADERARKLIAKSAKQQAAGGEGGEGSLGDDDGRSRHGVAGGLRRAASRARMKRSQSKRRPTKDKIGQG
ncbi:MAG: hypothetical protein INR71_00745 [Terriglobus roseus]|nr:hypothetical protein [Terriglobus roseus]